MSRLYPPKHERLPPLSMDGRAAGRTGALSTRNRLIRVIMKTHIYITCLFLVSGLTTRAFARAGDLREPRVAFPVGFSESARTNILASLRRPGCKFLGGHYVNSSTTLRYAGDTQALNLFLEGLSECPGVTLGVRFAPDGAPGDCDWLVSHLAAMPGEFTVDVNTRSPRITVQSVTIPKSKGPPLPKVK
jgi:hypothetical protein